LSWPVANSAHIPCTEGQKLQSKSLGQTARLSPEHTKTVQNVLTKKHNHILLCLCIRLVQAELAGYCECRNEPRGSAIRGEFLDQLKNCQFLTNSVPWTRQAAVCSAPGICATEHDIRVQQQQAFKSLWHSYICVLLRRQTRRLTSDTRLSPQARQHLFRWNPFLRKPNLNLLSPTSAPPGGCNEWHGNWCLSWYHCWWPLPHVHCAFYRPAFLQFHGYRVQCYYSPVCIQKEKTIIISDQTVTSRTTVLCGIALVLRRFLPPKFQSFNFTEWKVSEACGTRLFLKVSMSKSGSMTDYVYSPGWACDLHILKSTSLVSYKQERKEV